MNNVLSIDVEEYFHTSELRPTIGPDQWASMEPRVQIGVDRILELLDISHTKATFFVLGWVAEHHPNLLRQLTAAGHEIGCHGYMHDLVYEMTPDEFRRDTVRSMKAIRDACGRDPRAYRAPSYSIVERSLWALDVLADLGFTHDSSIYPIQHDRYGIPGYSRFAQTIETRSGPIVEVPIATVRLSANRTVLDNAPS